MMKDVNERLARWAVVGRTIGEAREAQRPRRGKRAAARAAGISDAHWRHIEAGRRIVSGIAVPPAVSPQVLEDAAVSVGLDPKPLFDELGWDYKPTNPAPKTEDRLSRLEGEMDAIRSDLSSLQEDVRQVLQRLDEEGGSNR